MSSHLVRLGVYTALLFACWTYNLLGLPDGMFWSRTEIRSGYLGSESNLVVCRLVHAAELPWSYPLAGSQPNGEFVPYPSQVGLTGISLAAIQEWTGLDAPNFLQIAAACFALAAALLVAAIFATAQHWLGPPTGDAACLLAASTPIFLPFAPSLYWATGLLLAPFAIVWCFGSWANEPLKKGLLLLAVGAAVFAKALCGYEYITAAIAAPAAAAWFHQQRRGEPWLRRIRGIAGIGIVGILGFAAAMAVHVVQQSEVLGQDGIAVIRNRAIARTASDPQAEAALSGSSQELAPSRFDFASRCFLEYFDQRAVSVAGGFGRIQKDVPLKGVVLFAAAFIAVAVVGRRRWPREGVALAGAVGIGFAASVSWQLLAVNHMCVHRHLNLIVFVVPFLPLAYLAAGFAMQRILGEPVARRLGPILLGMLVAAMGVNAWRDSGQRAMEAREQAAAEAAVQARLDRHLPPNAGLGGAVDRVRTVATVPDPLLIEYGLMNLATARPFDPAALAIDGWALGDCKPSSRPTTRIVIVRGDSIVRCRVLRFRRPDIERPVGSALPGSGFIAVVPSDGVNENGRVRLFVVAAANPDHMVELNVKP